MRPILHRLWFAGTCLWLFLVWIAQPTEGAHLRFFLLAWTPPFVVLFVGYVIKWIVTGTAGGQGRAPHRY